MTALDRPCQVLAMGSDKLGGPQPASDPSNGGASGEGNESGTRAADDAIFTFGGPGIPGVLDECEASAVGNEADRGAAKTFEQTTHVTLTVTTDSATQQPGLYLKYRDTFPSAEAARRYHDRVQDWLATRPDPTDEAPAPVIVEQPRSLHEILEFARDDAKFAKPVVERRPFDWARE